MPIDCAIEFEKLTDEEYKQFDHIVMGNAFRCHNELGRLCLTGLRTLHWFNLSRGKLTAVTIDN